MMQGRRTCIRDRSLITGRMGLQNKWRGAIGKVLDALKEGGGHNKFWGGFKMGV